MGVSLSNPVFIGLHSPLNFQPLIFYRLKSFKYYNHSSKILSAYAESLHLPFLSYAASKTVVSEFFNKSTYKQTL